MLAVTWDTVRVFLHVLAATVWVGGQLTLATLVPALRGHGRPVVKVAARRFNQIAWPAFGVLAATGVWNLVSVPVSDGTYRTTLVVKLVMVALSGFTAFLHARAKTTPGLAVFGALTAVTALAALFVGIMLG